MALPCPALLWIIEEALAAGIEEVILVVSPDDRQDFEAFFTRSLDEDTYNRLAPPLQACARHILHEIGPRLTFISKDTPLGFGHSVLCVRPVIGDEPFLLLLGDHLYQSTNEHACSHQLIHAYTQHGTSVIGLRSMPAERAVHYGAAAGAWREPQRLLEITTVIEKPSLAEIQDQLAMPGLPAGETLSFFGQYVLKPQIFEFLEEALGHAIATGVELQLTPAIERLRQADGLYGLLVEGQNFDIGLPEAYRETVKAWGN